MQEEKYTGPITDSHGGGCPKCGQNSGYRNVGRHHWDCCDTHMVKWHIGENLFSSWHEENEEIWERNAKDLEAYQEVEPIFPPEEKPAPVVLDANGERVPPWAAM